MKDHIFNIHDVVLLMTAAVCILLALFQAALPVKKRLYSRLLAAFLLIIATVAAATLLLWHEVLSTALSFDKYFLPYFLLVALMLKGPVLFLYVMSITKTGFRLRTVDLLHTLPALVSVILIAAFGIDSEHLSFAPLPEAEQAPEFVVTLLWDMAKLVPLAYACASVVVVYRYRAQLKDEYSHFSTTEPNWLSVLTLGFLASWTWSAIVHVIAKYSSEETADLLGIADNYITFVLINGLFTYSIAYAHNLLATNSETAKEGKNLKPTEPAIDNVNRMMLEEKIYLEHNLNIEQFASRIGMPVKEVSSVINKHFGTNFFEFINSYRVEEAKRMLSDPQEEHKTVLDVLLESGFNSKSAFHRFFKRLVGISPTEYRKQKLAEAEKSQETTN